MKIDFLEGELWYPATSEYGKDMPYDSRTCKEVVLRNNPTSNQMHTLLLSNRGRVLYHEKGFVAGFCRGSIQLDREIPVIETGNALSGEGACESGSGSLKTAFRYVSEHIRRGGRCLTDQYIRLPIYNTWMYKPYEVNQELVIDYAQTILREGLPKGIIIIDDKWSKAYGDWEFDTEKFPTPGSMVERLHEMGFLVMLWVCPYVDFKAEAYRTCKESDFLLKQGKEIYPLEWWNGASACFDLRKKEVMDYLRAAFGRLQDLGVDGFKLDGGDSRFYLEDHEPDVQSRCWSMLASEYEWNELRADFNSFGLPVFERLSDKRHAWEENGIGGILPSALALGLSGHQVISPDMIGGGEVKDIIEKSRLKEDIFMAHVQIALLMPNMQFSILPSLVLKDRYKLFLELLELRRAYLPYMLSLYEATRESGEPLVRLLEYEFPGEGYGYEISMFMLGNRYLVVPITNKDMVRKGIDLRLPGGVWRWQGKTYGNREVLHIDFELYHLVVLEKVDEEVVGKIW